MGGMGRPTIWLSALALALCSACTGPLTAAAIVHAGGRGELETRGRHHGDSLPAAVRAYSSRGRGGPMQPTRRRFDVLDFGAKGDGETDDAPAFQRALDAAANASRAVFCSPAKKVGAPLVTVPTVHVPGRPG